MSNIILKNIFNMCQSNQFKLINVIRIWFLTHVAHAIVVESATGSALVETIIVTMSASPNKIIVAFILVFFSLEITTRYVT